MNRSGAGESGSTSASVWIRSALLVCIGGAVGTTARALLEAAFAPVPGQWPWTTFVINVVGSGLLGLLYGALDGFERHRQWPRRIRLTIGTGVLGGFTTYSTFIVELLHLADTPSYSAPQVWASLSYAAASILLGVVAAVAGLGLGRVVRRNRGAL